MNKFTEFKKYFNAYQNKFGLINYRIFFKYEPVDGFADIVRFQEDATATVRLNNKVTKEDKQFQNIRGTAKHEALHLLLARFSDLAYSRYSTKSDIYEAEEELVRRLETLIPSIKL